MIRLCEVSKTYTSSTGQEVHAVKDASFCLPDSGMVCILGKSGSGKSTLLNLLGGLDAPTSGYISVDGVSMANFSRADYEGYRNDYLGFIFQEFNLLSDLNVRDNVALALQLKGSKSDDSSVDKALLQVGLNEKYRTRRVSELSGGEKQRIAIARCIVKNSKLILADEPTGNLDSATSESIWNLLKKISSDKLVVVVTHDSDSAERYADRVIKLADGLVVSDTGADDACETSAKPPKFLSKKLPVKFAVKLSFGNIGARALKTVSATLLLIFCILALLISQMFLCFSVARTTGRYVADNGVPFVLTEQQALGRNAEGKTYVNGVIKPQTERWLNDNVDYIVNCTVSNSDQLRNLGLSFEGEVLEPQENSFYVTSDFLDYAIKTGAYAIVDGNVTRLVKEYHSHEFLIGKQVYLSQFFEEGEAFPTLCGIIDSSSVSPLVEHYMPSVFASESFGNYGWAEIPEFSSSYNSFDSRDVEVRFGDGNYDGYFYVEPSADCFVATKEQTLLNYVCADDEIVLSYEMLSALYDVSSKYTYFNAYQGKVVLCPDQVGKKVHFAIADADTGRTIVDLGELTIAGVGFKKTEGDEEQYRWFALSQSNYDKIVNTLKCGAQVLVGTAQKIDAGNLLSQLDNRDLVLVSGGAVQTKEGDFVDCVEVSMNLEGQFKPFLVTVSVIAVILSVLTVLMIVNLIGCGIADRQKDIGIMSALGMPYSSVYLMFLSEVLLIAVVGFVLSLGLAFGYSALSNSIYSEDYESKLQFFRVDAITVLTVVAGAFVPPLLATVVPLKRMSRLKPIDAIRHL